MGEKKYPPVPTSVQVGSGTGATAGKKLSPYPTPSGRVSVPKLSSLAKQPKRQKIQLSHELNRFGGAPEPDGPTLVDESAGSGGTMREGVGKVGGVVVLGTSGPCGRPCGPMEILAVLRVTGA
jgi:hypothetical protein